MRILGRLLRLEPLLNPGTRTNRIQLLTRATKAPARNVETFANHADLKQHFGLLGIPGRATTHCSVDQSCYPLLEQPIISTTPSNTTTTIIINNNTIIKNNQSIGIMSGSVSTLTPTDLSSSDSSSPQQQAVDPPRTPSPKPSPSPNPAKLAALPFAKPVRGLSRDLAILEAAAEEGSVMMMDLDPLPPTPPAVSKLGLGLGLGMEITRGLGRRASTGSSDLEEAAGLLAVHERGDFAPPAFLSESPGSDVEMEFVDSEQSIEAVAGEIQRKKSPPIDFPYLNAPGRLGHPHPHPHRLLFDAHTASSTREREEEVEQSVAETLIQGEDELLFGSPDAELAPAPTDPHKSILQLDSLPLPISSDIPTDADTLPPTPTTYDAPMMLPLPMHAEEKKGEVEGAKPLPTPPPSPEAEAEMKKKEAGEGGVGWDLRFVVVFKRGWGLERGW